MAGGLYSRTFPGGTVGPPLSPLEGRRPRWGAGGVLPVFWAGNRGVKRAIYPVGFRWSTHMKPIVGTDRCLHAHLGFLAQGRIAGEYADRCAFDFAAPRVFVIEPGHDAWVVGDVPAVVVEFDA